MSDSHFCPFSSYMEQNISKTPSTAVFLDPMGNQYVATGHADDCRNW